MVAVLVLFAACGGQSKRSIPATYTVRTGDTVYAIAWRHGIDYRVLARWNNLSADYRIEPGQVLHLRPRAGQAVQLKPKEEMVAGWVWPADGVPSIVRHVASDSQGLLIAGAEGAPVRAAASGKVVYTGSGLRGFGNLVIIKHTNVFLSAYGHNRVLKVKEGDVVGSGQDIAEMGLGPGQKPALYFEIRYNGQPVDPTSYLPRHPP